MIDPLKTAKSDAAYAAVDMADAMRALTERQHDAQDADHRYKVACEKHGAALEALIALLSPETKP